MRRTNPGIITLLFVCSIAFAAACSSPVPATTTYAPTAPLQRGAVFYVTANLQRPRIIQSLREAGLKTTDQMNNGTYTLIAKVGSKRGSSQPCGTTNNVVYDLRSGAGRVLVIKGRGATGTCKPNVFDDMSQKLASYQ
jgi:hypothetical protein